MNNKNKNTVKNIILTSTIVAGSVLGLSSLNVNATETFKYHELGSGGELRSELLNNYSSDIIAIELECGEDTKKAEDGKAKKADDKMKDHKCGEGKCGEDKANMKKDKPADPKAAKTEAKTDVEKSTKEVKDESKTKEAKCGEGKCGD